MSDINWSDGSVCHAGGKFWLPTNKVAGCLANENGTCVEFQYLLECPDFQLNEIKVGDFIPASELDTEQKYNDVVEVFGLLGFEFEVKECEVVAYNYILDDGCANLKVNSGGYLVSSHGGNRKLTYSQIIAIGKLKRMMLECEKSAPETTADNSDQVKNPKHYQLIDGVESIEIIARSMTQEQFKGYCLGNVLKYRLRAGKKDSLQQDIDKANFYGELYEMHKEKCYD